MQRIAIVGGGAKAAAICAKAACLRDMFNVPIEVTVFERSEFGAHWRGAYGYTDGDLRLCTPPERDVGFPYEFSFADGVVEAMQSRFSWTAFAVARGAYGAWVDHGRLKPKHREFAAYLGFCIGRSGSVIVRGDVRRLEVEDGRWRVDYGVGGRSTLAPVLFDGVVVTGPGPALSRFPVVADHRIFDGVTFWSRRKDALTLAMTPAEDPIVIVGSGGAAASTAAWLVRQGVRNEIVILGKQPTVFTRTDSVFENRALRDAVIWASLSIDDRRAFTDRLTRGAVWSSVVDVLAQSDRVSYRPGKVLRIRHEPADGAADDIVVEFETSGDLSVVRTQPASMIVNGAGFDAAWFAQLLPPTIRDAILDDPDAMRQGMSKATELPINAAPRLQAPMMSEAVSLSYNSLMALGSLADAVLRPYVDAAIV